MRRTFSIISSCAGALVQLIGDARFNAHATTVRYPKEFRYDVNGTHHSLWYVHEQWDIDPFGFVIDCDEEDSAYLTVTYNLIKNGNRTIDLKRLKRRNIKPELVIRAKAVSKLQLLEK
jgi:hypothetical protein